MNFVKVYFDITCWTMTTTFWDFLGNFELLHVYRLICPCCTVIPWMRRFRWCTDSAPQKVQLHWKNFDSQLSHEIQPITLSFPKTEPITTKTKVCPVLYATMSGLIWAKTLHRPQPDTHLPGLSGLIIHKTIQIPYKYHANTTQIQIQIPYKYNTNTKQTSDYTTGM